MLDMTMSFQGIFQIFADPSKYYDHGFPDMSLLEFVRSTIFHQFGPCFKEKEFIVIIQSIFS